MALMYMIDRLDMIEILDKLDFIYMIDRLDMLDRTQYILCIQRII